MTSSSTAKYKVMLVAYKDIEPRVKNIITKHSVCNIKDKNVFDRLLQKQTNYQGSGRNFNLNDRIGIYLGWFKDKISEKLEEGYILDIIEVHKSYGNTREELLKALDIEYGDDILVLDIQEL
ncbi:hypothetical protein EDD65_10323 [Keratinibaculum paraultunense]|uniref:Uncharacterized protein n=1 Tax=Keratinibaculum paraultunense TaxID=1278232 RepID=A0A4R3KXQ1_9FIRM|nr:hypothetical protein [Keratinibaculum paraultunense]QQY80209.1 hypothetical protein JL105_02410 [Keratinibaculum paraultunense]TCS90720.1 hypothetical protein EDD65_10323 [Keratinibaculum paraultunense]